MYSSKDCLTREIKAELLSRNAVLFLGAGFSFPAGVPTFVSLRSLLAKTVVQVVSTPPIAISDPPILDHIEDIINGLTQSKQEGELLFETVLQVFKDVFGDLAIDWLRVLDLRIPHGRHEALAILARLGHIRHIITPNYDRLLEVAMSNAGIPIKCICPLDSDPVLENEEDAEVVILKPHGSFLHSYGDCSKIVSTLEQIGDAPHPITEAIFQSITRKKTVIFMGYRDKDLDLFPIFLSHLSDVKRILWVAHSESDLPSPDDDVGRAMILTPAPSMAGQMDASDLLMQICTDINLSPPSMTPHWPNIPDSLLDFLREQPLSTLVAAGRLMQETGHRDLAGNLFLKALDLEKKGVFYGQTKLRGLLYRGVTHNAHTTGEHLGRTALINTQKAVVLFEQIHNSNDHTVDAWMWLGYEWWSQIKAVRFASGGSLLTAIVLLPFYLFAGAWAFRRAIILCPKKNYRWWKMQWLICFYQADLIQSILGFAKDHIPLPKNCIVPLFRTAVRLHRRAQKLQRIKELIRWKSRTGRKAIHSIYNDAEWPKAKSYKNPCDYYLFRYLEAMIYGECDIANYDEYLDELDAAKLRYDRTGNDLSRANCFAYRALMLARYRKAYSEARIELQHAKTLFEESSGLKGIYRIKQFRQQIDRWEGDAR